MRAAHEINGPTFAHAIRATDEPIAALAAAWPRAPIARLARP